MYERTITSQSVILDNYSDTGGNTQRLQMFFCNYSGVEHADNLTKEHIVSEKLVNKSDT